jgi:hypothetical protein
LLREVEGIPVPALHLGNGVRLVLGLAPGELPGDDLLAARLEDVRAALHEQHAEDIFLGLRCIHLAAQNVRRAEEMALELG